MKTDEQLEKIIEHETSCVENAREVSDEFAVMPCTCGADKKISQIKQSILKAIMKNEIVDNEWSSGRMGYVSKNFVSSKDIKEVLETKTNE